VLSIDILESLVIRMDCKRYGFEVMTPMCQGSDYGIKLFVISAVITLRTIEFFTKIGKGPSGLD